MNRMKRCRCVGGLLLSVILPLMAGIAASCAQEGAGNSSEDGSQVKLYTGCCDASAGASLTEDLFVVASDEDNTLRIYRRGAGGPPVGRVALSGFLQADPDKPESDLEAAAQVGKRIYWITSHGRNKNAKERESRHRFFATELSGAGDQPQLRPVGRPYKRLLDDLLQDRRLAQFGLAEASRRAPKDRGGLNIEGLSADGDGHLLIGFRNPIPQGKALIVPLLNPNDVVMQGARAQLGEPSLVDLGGLGVRDIVRRDGRFWLIGGSYDKEPPSRLFVWDGAARQGTPVAAPLLKGLNPEALFSFPGRPADEFEVLSDDGTLKIQGKDCKKLADASEQRFRAVTIKVK